MNAKKSPQLNIEEKTSINLMIGLIIVLTMLFIVFEWSKEDYTTSKYASGSANVPDEDLIPITLPDVPPPPPVPAPPVIIDEIRITEKPIDNSPSIIGNEDNGAITIPDLGGKYLVPEPEIVDELYIYVEQMPEFNGNVLEFLSENLKYPTFAIETGLQGKVTCQFIVNKDGSITDIEVLRGVDPSLDKEAIRVIKSMPKWKPGKLNGKPVKVKYTLPVRFKLM